MARLRTHNNRARQARKMQRKMHAFLKRICIGTGQQTYHLERPWRPPNYSAAAAYFRAMRGSTKP